MKSSGEDLLYFSSNDVREEGKVNVRMSKISMWLPKLSSNFIF